MNGHDHTYQRWQPLDGAGNPSPSGVTEIVVGTGGHAVGSFITSDSRVVASATEFGALRLDLNSGGATFQFANTQGQVRDSGSVSCDSSGSDTTPPSDPTGLTATATYKTNIDLSWSASSDNVGVTGYKIYRDGAYLTDVGPQLTYSDGGRPCGLDAQLHGDCDRRPAERVRSQQPGDGDYARPPACSSTTVSSPATCRIGARTRASRFRVVRSSPARSQRVERRAAAGARRRSRRSSATETNLYYVTRFKVLSKAASTTINLLRFRDNLAAANAIATVSLSATDRINLRNDVTGVTTTSTVVAAPNAWHTLQAHIAVNGASSQTEVWLDGVAIPALGPEQYQSRNEPDRQARARRSIDDEDVRRRLRRGRLRP